MEIQEDLPLLYLSVVSMCQRENSWDAIMSLSLHYASCSRHVITRSNDFLRLLNSKEFTLDI